MFIFLSLPSGNEQPHSDKDRETLQTYQQLIRNSLSILHNSTYALGYGNITGTNYRTKTSYKASQLLTGQYTSLVHHIRGWRAKSILFCLMKLVRGAQVLGISPVKDKAYC